MEKWRIVLLSVLGVIVLLACIIAVRTATITSKQMQVKEKASYPIDINKAAERLSGAIKFKTVSNPNPAKVDYTQLVGLQEYMQRSFPLVHSNFEKKVINNYGLIYIWKGSDPQKKPMMLLGHQDVVPVAAEGWKHEPFSGDIADGFIWGRGTLDDKSCIFSILEAAEYLIRAGFKPTRSIYFAFGFDEEVGGKEGAAKISEYLKAQNLQFEYIIDEGMVITQGAAPGVKPPAALIGTAEKGYLSLELIAEAAGGHASMPPKQTTVGILAAAINKLENSPFPIHMTGPVLDLFDYLGPEMTFPYNMLFANRWLFGPVIQAQMASLPSTNAAIRTSTAPTMFQGSQQDNVLPSKATAVVNFRILPGETMQSVEERVKKVINDPRVKVQRLARLANDPSSISSINTWSFGVVMKTIREVMPDVLVAPMLVLGGTDCQHYVALSPSIYRFLPHRLYGDDAKMIHGTNEKIAVRNYGEMINYYIQLVKNSCT
jgi:carboxypeptidase PM20D1